MRLVRISCEHLALQYWPAFVAMKSLPHSGHAHLADRQPSG
jgi:hypothetical protein